VLGDDSDGDVDRTARAIGHHDLDGLARKVRLGKRVRAQQAAEREG
jgi:hypothetical protein